MLKALLLNSNYQVLQFVTDQKAICFLLKGKVDVLSSWAEKIGYGNLYYPAVIRLTYQVKRPVRKIKFSRFSVFKRDNFTCQYCGRAMPPKEITMDHIVARTRGGEDSFLNCVASCCPCNNAKGSRTIEQMGYRLIRKPFVPTLDSIYGLDQTSSMHESWKFYLPNK